jgi:glycosyltransferase 2 family protein
MPPDNRNPLNPIRTSEVVTETALLKTKGGTPQQILSWLVAVACLIWVFHDVHAEQLFRQIRQIHWGWVMLGVAGDLFSYYCQGWRWKLLLKPLGSIDTLRTTQAVYVGLFTNEIVPLRLGEVVRAWLVSRWMSVRLSLVVPSIAVERLFDGVWLGLGIGLTVFLVDLPANLERAADILGAAIIMAVGIFIYLVYRKEEKLADRPESSSSSGLLRRVTSAIQKLAHGVHQIGTLRDFYPALLVSSLILVFQILAFWFVMRGYGLTVTFWVGAVVLFIEHLGTMVPNAPSNLGTYQFFTVLGLTLFGVDKTTASGFASVVFIVLTLPLWAVGLLALSRTGMKFREIKTQTVSLLKRKSVLP